MTHQNKQSSPINGTTNQPHGAADLDFTVEDMDADVYDSWMTRAEFYELWQRRQLPDTIEFNMWAGLYSFSLEDNLIFKKDLPQPITTIEL